MKTKILFLILFITLGASTAFATTGGIDTSATNHAEVCHDPTCTSPTPGIINFKLSNEPSIVVDSTTGISGNVWGNELGWINFAPTGGGVTFADETTGLLTGMGWSQVSGWINFAPTGQHVTIDPCTGEWNGYAWSGGAYGGWIKFDCSDSSTCVVTTWRSDTASCITPPSGGGSSGGHGVTPPITPPPALPPTTPPVTPPTTPPTTPPSTPPVTPPGVPPTTPPVGSVPPSSPGGGSNPGGGSSSGGSPSGSHPGGSILPAVQSFLNNLTDNIPQQEPTLNTILFLAFLPLFTSSFLPLAHAFASGGFNILHDFVFLGVDPKKKWKSWGTVYDSVTKKPLPYAKVELLDKDLRVKETRFTNSEGVYGFLTTPAQPGDIDTEIQLRVEKEGYIFPSTREISNDTLIYSNIYHGAMVKIPLNQSTNFDIPIDPEYAKAPSKYSVGFISPLINKILIKGLDILFVLFIIFDVVLYVLSPNFLHLAGLLVLVFMTLVRALNFKPKPFGLVLDRYTKMPLAFVLVAAYDQNDRKIGFTVSNEQGRYILVAEEGAHKIKVYTPANITPPRSSEIDVPAEKGYIINKVLV